MTAAERLAAIRARVDADRPRCRDLAPHGVIVWTGTPRPRDAVKVIDRRKDDDSGWWMTDGSGLADYVWDGGGTWTTAYALLAEVQRRDDALDAVLALTEDEWGSRADEVERCPSCRRKWSKHTDMDESCFSGASALAGYIGQIRAAIACILGDAK